MVSEAATSALRCPCGVADPHVVARGDTFDGRDLCLWSSGPLTARAGLAIAGVPLVRPTSAAALDVTLRAGRLVLGEACVWTLEELPALYAAARRVAARGGMPGDLRAAMATDEAAVPHVPIRWEVLTADNRGRITCRVGTLPPLWWRHTGVWHERGRYEVVYRGGDGAWLGSGITFTSQRELSAFLIAQRDGQRDAAGKAAR